MNKSTTGNTIMNEITAPDFDNPIETARSWIELAKLLQEKTEELAYIESKTEAYKKLAHRKMDAEMSALAERLGTSVTELDKFLKAKGIISEYDNLPMPGYEDWFTVIGDVPPSDHE